MEKVCIGIIGSGFSGNLHAAALQRDLRAEIVAVAGSNRERAEKFAAKWKIPQVFDDYRRMLEFPDIDLVTIGAPNDLHCRMAVDRVSRRAPWRFGWPPGSRIEADAGGERAVRRGDFLDRRD